MSIHCSGGERFVRARRERCYYGANEALTRVLGQGRLRVVWLAFSRVERESIPSAFKCEWSMILVTVTTGKP